MKSLKLSFDLSDEPQLVELLRLEAARSRHSQKAILVQALKSHFAEKLDTALLSRAAERTFAEWNNEEDSVYDTL